MGPRFPPGVPRAEKVTQAFAGRPDYGADRDGDGAGADRHRPTIEVERRPLVRREFQPAESHFPRRSKIVALRPSAGFYSRTAYRARDRLLCEREKRRVPRGEI